MRPSCGCAPASEDLTRLEDVLKQVESQGDSLQAGRRGRRSRYRELAARIRRERGARRARVLPDRRRSVARGRRRGSRPTSPRFGRRPAGAGGGRRRRRRSPRMSCRRLREREAESARRSPCIGSPPRGRRWRPTRRGRGSGSASLTRQIEQFMRDLEREGALIADASAGGASGSRRSAPS